MIPPFPSFLTLMAQIIELFHTWVNLQQQLDDDVIPPFPWELFAAIWSGYVQLLELYNGYTPVSRMLRALLDFDAVRHFQDRDMWATLSSNPETFWYYTGETPDSLLELVNEIAPLVQRANRGGHMDIRNRVLLVFVWLRQYPTHHLLASMFGISQKAVVAELFHVLPILHETLVPREIV
jgi:hypothetical protein